MNPLRFTRRNLLRGSLAATAAFPLLESRRVEGQSAAAPTRLVVFTTPNGTRNARQGEDRRFIEVKGRAYRGPISLSANEYSAAKRLGRNYWLYVVFNCSSTPEVLAINDPARLNWKPLSKIEQYQVAASDIVRAKP